MDCGSVSASLRKCIRDDIGHFGLMKFDFQLGTKVRNALASPEFDLGKLSACLERDDESALRAAKNFVWDTRDRGSIIAMLDRAENRIDGLRSKGIDGAARNKLVAEIIKIRDQAAQYAETRIEMNEAREQERPKVREWVAELRRQLTVFIARVDLLDDGAPVGEASAVAIAKLKSLDALLAGKGSPNSSVAHLLALHGPLALIPELHFGRSWFPTPYDPASIAASIETQIVPLLPADQSERDDAYLAIVNRRLDDRSFVAARLLVDMASDLGVSEMIAATQDDQIRVCVDKAKEDLQEQISAVKSRIDRVLRFGAVSNKATDLSEKLMSEVRQIESANVFADVSHEERLEHVDDERISDARLAFDLLDEINEKAGDLLHQPREEMISRIDKLGGRLTPLEIANLKNLVADDDLHTAEEYVETVETTGALPASPNRNRRFKSFADDVLPALMKEQSPAASNPAEHISQRRDYCGIKFSELTVVRAEEAAAILNAWRDLHRRLPNMRDINFNAQFMSFAEKIGLDGKVTPIGPKTAKIYIADHEKTFSKDSGGLLLPDFGSRSKGQRLALTSQMPNDATLTEICESAPSYFVILFVTDFISPLRRAQFFTANLRANRRIILIDSATLVYALGEPEFRPLTLLELGQPYSYVAPYKDWQREAVPPEMFVGREDDINQIFSAEGSCVVYGGRRMGKTALLRHIKETKDKASKGMQIGYVDLQPIWDAISTSRRIWSVFADSLPAVFLSAASQNLDQNKFSEAVRKWLSDDGRRRILLCIDESDKFVVADAAQNYPIFYALQQLMTDTGRRFKFVLSGLADVTRFGQTGNSPLKHISANPLRIGPLMGKELRDAEDLVLRPFAAMGIEFEKRQDVWRILSHSNYYPVLIQTYSQKLLEMAIAKIKEHDKPIRRITSKLVSEVLDDAFLRADIKSIFMITLRLDPRYLLIAYPNAPFKIEDVDIVIEAENLEVTGFGGKEVVDAGTMLGLIVPIPAPTSGDERKAQYGLSEFATRLFNASAAQAAE
jgi:hypothetical protein